MKLPDALTTIEGVLGLHRSLQVTYEVDQFRAEVCDDSLTPIYANVGATVEEALINLANTIKAPLW